MSTSKGNDEFRLSVNFYTHTHEYIHPLIKMHTPKTTTTNTHTYTNKLAHTHTPTN